MSYILEALKRSEQERTRGTAPTLHVVHAEPIQKEGKGFRFYALAACVLVATALIGWQRPWQSEKGPAGESDLPPAASAVPLRIVPQAAVAAAPVRPPIAAMQEPPPVSRNTEQRMEQPAAKVPSPVSENPAKEPPPAVSAAPSKPKTEAPATTASRHDAVDFSDLPTAIQQALNKLVITGYVDSPSDPSGQMIAIDNRLLREGDEISPDLKLEQIAAGKAVFGYKGYRFRVPLP